MPDSLSTSERLALIKVVNSLVQADFDTLLFALDVPYGVIPSSSSAQGNRASALFQWVQSPTGCGLSEFLAVLEQVVPGKFTRTAPTPESAVDSSFQEMLGDITLDMVYVPGGTFLMGSSEDDPYASEDERPQHIVKVPAFYVGKYPVTQRQWQLVAAMPKDKEDLRLSPSYFKGSNRPVETVSWHDALEFCSRLSRFTGKNYRLPSEAEWEYACRAGTTTAYAFGETLSPEQANFGKHYKGTTEVGRFSPNAFGLYDMHGNVSEWCQDDWHEDYKGAPNDGSAWINERDKEFKVFRGGAWETHPSHCRSTSRVFNFPDFFHFNYLGFRVVCVAPSTL